MRSNGSTSVCGQFDRRWNDSRQRPAWATRSSHTARRCGSSASALTVRMPKMVSPRAADLSVSAVVTLR